MGVSSYDIHNSAPELNSKGLRELRLTRAFSSELASECGILSDLANAISPWTLFGCRARSVVLNGCDNGVLCIPLSLTPDS